MTNETKAVIASGISKLFDDIEESILIGAAEEVGPNSNEYEPLINKYWEESIDKIDRIISIYKLTNR